MAQMSGSELLRPLFFIARIEFRRILALEKSKTFSNFSLLLTFQRDMKLQSYCSAILLLGLSVLAVGCKTRNAPAAAVPPAPVPPAQYGQQPGAPVPPDQAGGRFGYTGQAPATGTTAPPAAGGIRDIREMPPANSTTPAPAEQKPTPPQAPSTPSAADMPYANAVAGNPLVVTLPGANASLGQISIEKYDSSGKPTGEPLKRGTQVQIPDPNNPGKKIFFKVP